MKLSYRKTTFITTPQKLSELKRRMRWVRAAGCVVCDESGDMLLICRNGRWDLPKGKVESGETLLQAALRETAEETGLEVHPTASGRLVVKTYHVYNLYGGWHLKQTAWFEAQAAGIHPAGRPQADEGITDVVWVNPDQWRRRLGRSYGTLRIVASRWRR